MSWYQWHKEILFLNLKVQPKSSQNLFVGPYDNDHFKIKITAPPIDGKANKHLCRFLAKAFGVSTSQIKVIKGQSSGYKQVSIHSPKKFPIPISSPPHQNC